MFYTIFFLLFSKLDLQKITPLSTALSHKFEGTLNFEDEKFSFGEYVLN